MEPFHQALLRQLVRALRQQGPSPASRGPPGYLRAFTAEAAPQVAAEEAAAAAAASGSSGAATGAALEAQWAAAAAQGQGQKAPTTLSAFLGLTNVLEQQQAQLAGPDGRDRLSPALRAMTWHQRYMDDTPAGRELRRNWQRQVREGGGSGATQGGCRLGRSAQRPLPALLPVSLLPVPWPLRPLPLGATHPCCSCACRR